MSAYSDWRCGALTDEQYAFASRREYYDDPDAYYDDEEDDDDEDCD